MNSVILLANKTLKLGRKDGNEIIFEPIKVAEVSLDSASACARKAEIVSKVPSLEEHCRHMNVPRLFAEAAGYSYEEKEVMVSGGRTFYDPDRIVELPLSALGIDGEAGNTVQKFVVDDKGAGRRLSRVKHADRDQIRRYAQEHNVELNEREELFFSRNRYKYFHTPEGTHLATGSRKTIQISDWFTTNGLGIKIAPQICGITYPQKIFDIASVFNIEGNVYSDEDLSHERRLIPSNIRGTFFECNGDRENINFVSMLTAGFDQLLEQYIQDAARYFNVVPKTARESGEGYSWCLFGDCKRVFQDRGLFDRKDYAWFIAKDIVVANTGLYFVDLDSIRLKHKNNSYEDMLEQQTMYYENLLRDLTHILTRINVAMCEQRGQQYFGRTLEQETHARLYDAINNLGIVKIAESGSELTLDLEYEHLGHKQLKVNKEILSPIYY